MSFSAFSKDFTANMYTSVENQFITKYLPQAKDDAVRVYLYGLYLCSRKEETDGESVAKLLKLPYSRLLEIYDFWEECDLVHILSREPLLVEYLPVNGAVGKPKPIRPEKYAGFNRELLKRLSKAGKDFKPYEMARILEFLENNPMEQQALLLVAEYCIKKDGEKISAMHILNKAKKLCDAGKFTYEQVEGEFLDYHKNERQLEKLFRLLSLSRKPQEQDYDFLEKWLGRGMEEGVLNACASHLKRGTLSSLDVLLGELDEKGVRTTAEAEEYLARRNELADAVFRIARRLGVKVQNPRAYMEEYAEKWFEHGYDAESLMLVASLCFKLRYGFSEMDSLLDTLYAEGIVDGTGVKDYCAARDRQLRLLQSVQAACGVLKKSQSALDMIAVWQSWNFSDAMILEAAKRSAGAAAPLPYMNKLLSEWKRTGVFAPEEIPERQDDAHRSEYKSDYKSEAAIAADERTARDRFYAARQQRAAEAAERARERAHRDEGFRTAESAVKREEIELARAEVYSPEKVSAIEARLEAHRRERAEALARLSLSEEDLLPKYVCPKCRDTGFLPNGKPCDCYHE